MKIIVEVSYEFFNGYTYPASIIEHFVFYSSKDTFTSSIIRRAPFF